MFRSNSTAHRAYSMALKAMENRPTVKPVPFLLRYRPSTSSPPVEQPQVRISPPEKPPRIPPTRQEVSLSAMMGVAGDGITASARELMTVVTLMNSTKFPPMVRHASQSSGIFTSRYRIPARSKDVSSPSSVFSSVRATWQKPYRPPL